MLSISTLGAGHAASGYYRAEGYYIAGTPEAEQSAIYHGQAAQEAGLTGRVADDDFTALLDGQTPDGRTLGRIQDGERKHRPGVDLTFSAPKGVSIAALVGGDSRIIAAHTDAVKVALDYAEANLVQTRRMVNGQLIRETGGRIIAGVFQHDTSRALDPQLHSHAVITNMVKDSTGTFRALSNEALYRGKMLLGQIYRNALAERLEALGYETQRLDKGLFDIKGIPAELVDTFSKRREEIEKALADKNYEPTAKASALATLATRASKKPVERAELRAAWDAEIKALGIDLAQTLKEAGLRQPAITTETRDELTTRAVDFAITHHAERNAVYARGEVVMTALKFAPSVNERAVSAELDRLVEDKVLYAADRKGEIHFTDKENIRLEHENNTLMRATVGRQVLDLRSMTDKATRCSSDAIIQRKLDRTTLTEGQKEAVALTLSSKGGVVGVQGYAGTGKTYMLASALRMAEARGYTLEGLAPSHKAVSALNEALPSASTVESALVRHENGANLGDKSKTILVVDEASMMSSDTMHRVLHMARSQGYVKTVLVGDIKQLEAVGAGSSFRALQEAGMPTALMSDIQRQRTDEGREAVLAAIAGNVAKAMEGVSEVSETHGRDKAEIRNDIALKLAETYSAIPANARSETGLIVLTNAMRRQVNGEIQNNLKLQGEIGGGTVEISSLSPRNFTQAEASEIGSYRKDDIVVAPVGSPKAGLVANTLYKVTDVSTEDRKLELASPAGETATLDLGPENRFAQRLAVFKPEKQTFIEGDRVKFKITDRAHGIVNSAEGVLTRAGDSEITIRTKEGEALTMPVDSLAAKGMQLAYATTAHDFQGSTVDRVLLGMSSEEHLTTQKSFYVSLSRMRDGTHLVTNDLSKLSAQIRSETGERVNALEALAEERERVAPGGTAQGEDHAREALRSRDADGPKPTRDADEKAPDKTGRETEKTETEMERQLSLLDKLMTQTERDQKTRDERSR